ncbi:glutamyl aminopeptidase [Amia ocellicauda]|uniref:glutamyl aminopeptidase n=1 Tax=Amia ocellicauda TaxID=2972642 RepID=UPI003463977D
MQDMETDEKPKKTYCMRGKHVAIICGVVVVSALVVGLAVGLSKSETCEAPEDIPGTEKPPTTPGPPAENRGPCHPSDNSNGDWNQFRLPDYVKPTHYDLHVNPNLDTDIYTGSVIINLSVTQPTKHLWLHIRETFVSALPKLQKKSGNSLKDVALVQCFEYKTHEYVVIEAQEILQPTGNTEQYVLTLDFQGWLNGSLVGFYKTTYMENGVLKKIAATDHEPTDARKSFPCFDEPNKKATYTVSITHDSAYTALSNMPVEQTVKVREGFQKTSFKESVPMSTYLVCFAVHQFTFLEKFSDRGVPLRIYVQPEQKHTAEYAANVTKIIFDAFEKYFNVIYSLPKLDKIAIPDFGTGAMENWGLITYRENNLLYDENESSSNNKQRVATVISHELVHQWFGNIVTMDWWDDLWLNEGFASFFEYVGVEAAEATWKMREMILVDDVLPVMVDDALLSSHPIIFNVSTPAEITSVFDGISYSKGASILRMLEDWISPQLFKEGCQKYLKDHHFQNARTEDFWQALAVVSQKPVAEVMDTWTKQMGYPVLKVSPTTQIQQTRFLLDPNADPATPPSPLNYKWNIPIQWHSLGSGKNGTAFYNRTQTTDLTLPEYSPDVDGLLKVNREHLGFYRVNYHTADWDRISEKLSTSHKAFLTGDRAGLIDDVFSLARASLLDYGYAFNLTKYISAESEYIVWERLASSISYVRTMLKDDDTIYPKFQTYFRNQVKNISTQLGWEDTGDHLTRLLRETVLGIACQMGDQSALDQASALFERWLRGERIAVNLRLLVYRYGMQNSGNETSWNYMFQKYIETPLAQEKDKLLYGLASVQNITLLDRFLKSVTNETIVRSQDMFTIIRYISYNTYGRTMAWDWTTLNWDYLLKRFTLNDRNLGRLPNRISNSFNTELQLWQMQLFFEKYPEAGAGEVPRKQALETVRNNIEWLKANKNAISKWLESNVQN